MAWVLVHHCGRRADDGRDALAYAAALRDTALHRMFVLACEAGRYARARIPEFPDALKENPPRQGFFEFDVADLVAQHLPEDERDAFEYALHSGWLATRRSRRIAATTSRADGISTRLPP